MPLEKSLTGIKRQNKERALHFLVPLLELLAAQQCKLNILPVWIDVTQDGADEAPVSHTPVCVQLFVLSLSLSWLASSLTDKPTPSPFRPTCCLWCAILFPGQNRRSFPMLYTCCIPLHSPSTKPLCALHVACLSLIPPTLAHSHSLFLPANVRVAYSLCTVRGESHSCKGGHHIIVVIIKNPKQIEKGAIQTQYKVWLLLYIQSTEKWRVGSRGGKKKNPQR